MSSRMDTTDMQRPRRRSKSCEERQLLKEGGEADNAAMRRVEESWPLSVTAFCRFYSLHEQALESGGPEPLFATTLSSSVCVSDLFEKNADTLPLRALAR
eukprot:TRINITY_DN2473_c0_g2_i5.p1 TRINITY_DN2473_c0_g2~~TRINITY_DN2473_c0_g2_i5.p1  ORF type:complete len:100 (+),score=4.66 TRINITY_DN2473_c0_g2_i5:77-376(+)